MTFYSQKIQFRFISFILQLIFSFLMQYYISNVRESSFKALKYAFLLVRGTVELINCDLGSVSLESIFASFSSAETVLIGFLAFPRDTNPKNKNKL